MSLKDWIYSGLIVETRCGIKYIVVGDKLYGLNGFSLINECYNDDLNDLFTSELDIVKIYENKRGSLNYILEVCDNLKLIKEINN